MSEKIQVFVKTLTGKEFPLNVDPDETIDNVRKMIQAKEGIPPNQQVLVSMGSPVHSGTLRDNNIQKDGTIFLAIRLHGGHY